VISAKAFAAQSTVWHRCSPALEQFTRWVNRNLHPCGIGVVRLADPKRAALIAEAASAAAASGQAPTSALEVALQRFLAQLPGAATAVSHPLSPQERHEVRGLHRNIARYLEVWAAEEEPKFAPLFPGCGAVDSANGDILVDGELIEVKAVERPFRGIDFRQAITYAALGYASDRFVERITLLNPRAATFYSASTQELALDIGAGSWVELMQDLVETMSGFDVSG
jgi:hypothetical protein